jgi:hypothetical protein
VVWLQDKQGDRKNPFNPDPWGMKNYPASHLKRVQKHRIPVEKSHRVLAH